MPNLKKLKLNETYEFNVVVTDEKEKFGGKLSLSQSEIILETTGDLTPERCATKLKNRKIPKLVCHDGAKTFILHNLTLQKNHERAIGASSKKQTYFSARYQIDYVVFSSSQISSTDQCHHIEIDSQTINKWVGSTNLQDKIENNDHTNLTEFQVEIQDKGTIYVSYNLKNYYSRPEFKSGFNYPPSISFKINSQDIDEAKKTFDYLYNFLVLITGNELDIRHITLALVDTYNTQCSLYFCPKVSSKLGKDKCIFFPLTKDKRLDVPSLPAFPIASFANYFSLDQEVFAYWQKYIKYQRMGNLEDRFLGYFRLLESLCFQKKAYLEEEKLKSLAKRVRPCLIKVFEDKKSVKSFLDGLPRYNNSKYNTEKNILDFFNTIPLSIRNKWTIKSQDIKKVCKLRNDIIHANYFEISTDDLSKITKFIEVLLVLFLLKKVNIEFDVSTKIINRLQNYDYYLIYSTIEINW